MKIVAGKVKGKKLITLDGKDTRPTLTRIKENIFNILQNFAEIEDLIIVDFFGGSGSLSCESLSRGAKFAYINDVNRAACEIITTNITNCNFTSMSKITNFDYQTFIKTIPHGVDILFIDPPFVNLTCQQWIIDYCNNNNLLNNNALLILETNVKLDNLQLNSKFKVISEKKYGKIYIKFIRYQINED